LVEKRHAVDITTRIDFDPEQKKPAD
jgi:hypothetical protein